MVYLEYDDLKAKKLMVQKELDELISRKTDEFLKTQPKAVRIKEVNVAGGKQVNSFDEYIVHIEPIDREIMELKSILHERDQLLQLKELELRRSSHIYDKIYRMYFLDNMKPYLIMIKLNCYSLSSVYRIIDRIRERLGKNKKNK